MKQQLTWASVLTAALLIAVSGYAATMKAQNLSDSQSQFTITPVAYETTVDPGATITNKLTVSNNTDKPIILSTSVENIRRTNNEGVVELTNETTPYDLLSWVTFEPKEFTLASRGSQDIGYTIKVPENASPGGHYGSILLGTPPIQVSEGSGAAVVQRIGSLVLIRVNGDIKEDASVSSFRTKTYVGTWEEVVSSDGKTRTLVAREEDKSKEKYQSYYSKGPIAFDTVINNKGNVHIKPAGYVTVYNVFNKKIAELPLNSQNVFPNSERSMTVIWPKERLWGIYYKAQFVGLYGADNDKSLTHSTSFWAFPKEAAIAIGVAIILILLLRRRLSRAFVALFTGNAPKEPSAPKAEPKESKTAKEDKDEKDDEKEKDKKKE